MGIFENRSGMYFLYMSSGSAKNSHLQQVIVELDTIPVEL